MMVEQAGDCIGFLGFLSYVGPCLLGKKSVHLKKMFIVINYFYFNSFDIFDKNPAYRSVPGATF